jgi:hypothetical protein
VVTAGSIDRVKFQCGGVGKIHSRNQRGRAASVPGIGHGVRLDQAPH